MGNKQSESQILNKQQCKALNDQLGQNFSKFTFNLYKKLAKSQNLIFSPASIYIALSMAALGSNNQTLLEFKDILGFSNQSQLAENIGLLLKILQQNQQGITTQIANKIYQGIPQLGIEYYKIMMKHFDSMIQKVNFASDCEQIRVEINKWVEEVTKEKIKDLLPPNCLNQSTAMVLVNAIYFKGNWLKKFDFKLTEQKEFYLEYENFGQKIQTDTMVKEDEYYYFQNSSYQYVQIPYKGGEYFMELMLPKESLNLFEQSLSEDTFQSARKNKYNRNLTLYLPKFKLQPVNTMSLNQILNELGLIEAFSCNADFSIMDPNKNIQISNVFHKSMIEVNEEGAEAAAATAITFIECEESEISVIFNKPFIYAITHIPSETVLFMGKVTDPSKQN
ncbi:proteinase inhibitor I4 serpin (macronuclear) [Tetrahymena thermophila SB210]|uniref:Proteinase inhibitor I4 serpin n=1 Tax=Tetrahymena thermophila (strain SB210) TaxID=312017 RepID=I7MFX0_TETTS|nr:proteinase inhibitor I4 serpin [Tetrahymena thermophila SB210]EAR84456.1 proteinase inhibitor I4 serpin [Tetrahymena thermophila SB210]|eukprot:XP_001032119.1 proteinase inhibitor I4 serpin [Tetrahymena thermophila SB210]